MKFLNHLFVVHCLLILVVGAFKVASLHWVSTSLGEYLIISFLSRAIKIKAHIKILEKKVIVVHKMVINLKKKLSKVPGAKGI